jgi:selenocysteine lyase/cysteine desulfurase
MRGATWVDADRFEIAPTAMRYEDWEFPYALVLGLGAAARYALDVGIDVAGEQAFSLARRVRDGVADMPGGRVLDAGQKKCAIVTAMFESRDAREIVNELTAQKINTTSSLKWYGLLDFSSRGVDAALRISPHYFNTEEEVDAALGAIRELI